MRPLFASSHFGNTHTTPSTFDAQDTQLDLLGSGDPFFQPDVFAQGIGSAEADITLEGSKPGNQVTLTGLLNAKINLAAFDPLGLATASVTGEVSATITTVNGISQGEETAGLSLDVAVFLPSVHALVDVRINDTLDLTLKAMGFLGANTTFVSETSQTFAQGGSGGPVQGGKAFDLGAFVAAIFNKDEVQVNFSGLTPGESFRVMGQERLTVDASVLYLAGGLGSAVVGGATFHQSTPLTIAFDQGRGGGDRDQGFEKNS